MSSIFGNSHRNTVAAPVFEGYGVEINGDLLALEESFQDQKQIVQAIHAMDMGELRANVGLRQLQESGASEEAIEDHLDQFEIATESAVKSVWEKIKNFFKNLWGKLKAFFNSVVRFFDGVFRSGESFAKKYESDLKKLDLSGYEVKLYNYTHLEDDTDVKELKDAFQPFLDAAIILASGSAHAGAEAEKLKERLEESQDNKEEKLDEFRGKMVNKGSLSADQFKEALFGYFRDGARGEDDKKEVKVEVTKFIEALKDSKPRKHAENLMKKSDEELGNIIAKVNEIENKVSSAKSRGDGDNKTYTATVQAKGDGAHSTIYTKDTQALAIAALRALSSLYSGFKDIQLQAFRAWKDAWVERDAAYKSVLVGAFRHKKAK